MLKLHLSEEVGEARERGAALVALETTILSHGMPYPQNLETAREVECIVRDAGAVPATIAVLEGEIRVGLSDAELERVAREPMLKIGSADLAYAVAARANGATTVAGTVRCAALARIAIFATGGIGGVHRGATESMDVSGDLDAIASAGVAVICAGAKAILDLPKTLEALETRGVPVVAYRTDEFPAFWSRTSGLRAPLRLDDARAIAALIAAQRDVSSAGVVVANPIAEHEEIPQAEMERYIEHAVADAAREGIAGKALTPWLLDHLLTLTGSRSLRANIALVRSNAQLAAEIAVALQEAS